MIWEELLNDSRLLQVLHDNLPLDIKQSVLYSDVISYLKRYCSFNGISTSQCIGAYTKYINTYNKHCKLFAKTGKYPLEINDSLVDFTRSEYDIILLLSVLFAPHRFEIMKSLERHSINSDDALYIGVGPGLEMFLTQNKHARLHAYDLSLNPFVVSEFPRALVKAELYKGQKKDYFEDIYLIELLEHLDDPFTLLALCADSLKQKGRVIFTTATDIPQFDHLYNFSRNHYEFDQKLNSMGFAILHKKIIEHNYLLMQLKPCNHFYIVEKN